MAREAKSGHGARPELSIRWVERDPGPCACGRRIGWGPVGFDGETPVCDACLMQRDEELAKLLVMVDLVRDLAGPGRSALESRLKSVLLTAAGRFYTESTRWPRRPSSASALLEEYGTGSIHMLPELFTVH